MPGYGINTAGDIKYLTFGHFTSTGLVEHAFMARSGGVSQPPYHSLNLAMHVGDDRAAVVENRKRACAVLGADLRDLVCGRQVHGSNVYVVTEKDRGRGAHIEAGAISVTDALVTNRPGLLLSSYYADCVPVMILDPVRRAIALVHAGWKGTVMRIAAAALEVMHTAFGTAAGDCLAAIAPSIGPCCYEVDKTVISLFMEKGFDSRFFTGYTDESHCRIDLRLINQAVLEEAGVKAGCIETAELCTACRDDLFFSYRGQSGQCGRMASLMMLR